MTFKTFELARGARVHVLQETRFRRTHVALFMSGPLNTDTASPLALLPAVLVRGTAKLPKADLLEKEMAGLFGARIGAGVSKSGDHHILRIAMNLSDEKYAGAPVLGKGLELLADVLEDPYMPGGGFDQEYVAQEKMQLIGRIRALVNNKVRYAMKKASQEIFRGEPFAISEEGTEEQVSAITPESLARTYGDVLKTFPMDIYVVGDVNPEEAAKLVADKLKIADRDVLPVPKSIVRAGDGGMRRSFATEQMEQGWIILGIKSDVVMSGPERWVLAMTNGVLGGYPHSKLFANVREKASLAYGTSSFYEPTKGTVIAYAGIDPKNYGKASDLMLAQLGDMAKGDIADDELEATLNAMTTDLRLQLDTPGWLIHTHFTASGEGCYEDVPGSIEAVSKVTKDQIIDMAGRLRPDTLFFLSGMEEKELTDLKG